MQKFIDEVTVCVTKNIIGR